MKINVTLEKVVLEGGGLDGISASQLKSAIAAELHTLFSMQAATSLVMNGRNEQVLRGAEFSIDHGALAATATAKNIGSNIGKSVFRSMTK
jgi:hypothetical protein